MNENIQRAEIVYKALRDNKIPVGCAALGIIKSALEYDQLQTAPGQLEKDIATVAKLCAAAPDLLEACELAIDWFNGEQVSYRELMTKLVAAAKKATTE